MLNAWPFDRVNRTPLDKHVKHSLVVIVSRQNWEHYNLT